MTTLNEPLLALAAVKELDMKQIADKFSKSTTISKSSPLLEVFQEVGDQGDFVIEAKQIQCHPLLYIMTINGNVVNYCRNEEFIVWSLKNNKNIFSESMKGVSVLYETPKGSRLFIGFKNGILQSRDTVNYSIVQQTNLKSAILAVTSDDKSIYVSLKNGRIVSYPVKDISSASQKTIRTLDKRSPISVLKLSKDDTFLIGYVDIDGDEMINVFNLTKKDQPWEAKLDLSSGDLREDPDKLIVVSDDCLNVFARGENSKGVVMYSLFDGSVVSSLAAMHTNYINQILVTKDSKKVLTCGKDRKIKVWDWIKLECLGVLALHEDSVECMSFNDDETLLFTGSKDSFVQIWSMLKLEHLVTLKSSLPIRSLAISGDNDQLLVSSNEPDKRLAFWSLESNSDAFRIGVSLNNVSNCYVTPNNEYLVTMTGNTNLKIWNLKSRVSIESYKVDCSFRYNLRALNGTRNSESIFFQKDNSEVIEWSCSQQKAVHTFIHAEQVQDIVITSDDLIMYCATERYIYKWDLITKELIFRFQHPSGYFLFLVLSSDNKCLYANGSGADIFKYDLELDEKQELMRFDIIQNSGWVNFELSPDGDTLIQTNQYNGSFWVVSLKEQKVVQIVQKHSNKINFVGFSGDGRYLITRSPNEAIIWDCKTWKELINIQEAFGIVTSSSRYVQAIIHDGLYKTFNDEIFIQFSDDFTFSEEEEKGKQEGTKSDEIKREDIQVTGKLNNLAKLFIAQVLKLKKSGLEYKYIPYLLKTQIRPFKLNLAHYYAYFNNENALSFVLRHGCPYAEDIQNKNPLDYAIEKKSYESATVLLDYVMKRKFLYNKISKEKLTNLIEFAPSNIKEFFDEAVVEQEGPEIPSFGQLISSPVSFYTSENSILSKDDVNKMVIIDKNSDSNEPLIFKTVQIHLNLQPGSASSVGFHRTLGESDLTVFRSESIQSLLTYKWDLVKRVVYANGLVYLGYMIALFAFLETYSWIALCFLIAFGIYFAAFEIMQIALNKLSYISDFWNLFDFLRVVLLIIFVFNAFSYEDWHQYKQIIHLLGTLNLLSWIRALSFLRLFQKTRIFIRLLVEVIFDMVAFLIVLVGGVIGISLTYQVINGISLIDALRHNYRLMFGDFETDDYTQANWVLFIFASVLIPLIMLNMLVAIMSDTYARVMSDILPSDFLELNQMILEQEEIQYWNRNKGQPVYMHFAKTLSKKDESEWEGQIQKILQILQEQSGSSPDSLKGLDDKIDLVLNGQRVSTRDTNLKFDEQKKRFDKIQLELDIVTQKDKNVVVNAVEDDVDSDGSFFDDEHIQEQRKDTSSSFKRNAPIVKNYLNNQWKTQNITKSGKINIRDGEKVVKAAMKWVGQSVPSDEEFQNVLREVDSNGDGQLSKAEVYVFIHKLIGSGEEAEEEIKNSSISKMGQDAYSLFLKPEEQRIFQDLWSKYDKEGKDQIDSSLSASLIEDFSKVSLSSEKMEKLIRCLDKNGDGIITKNELATFISENTYLLNDKE